MSSGFAVVSVGLCMFDGCLINGELVKKWCDPSDSAVQRSDDLIVACRSWHDLCAKPTDISIGSVHTDRAENNTMHGNIHTDEAGDYSMHGNQPKRAKSKMDHSECRIRVE